MNNSKANRRLRNLWYKKDLVAWIDLKVKLKRYPKNTEANDVAFKLDMTIWNYRYTHEEIQLLHYKDWHPYCCNELTPCASRAWDRMVRTNYGWYCPFCRMKLGKHLHRILPAYDGRELDTWNNHMGLFAFKPMGGFPIEMRPTIKKLDTGPNEINRIPNTIYPSMVRAGNYIVKQPKPIMIVSAINV
jgi:hypothetical protein